MQTWNTWSKRGHVQTWNILSTPERAVPRNGHGLFKGISYGLRIRNIATTVLKAQVHCIGIEPVIGLAEMPASSSAAQSKAQPGTTAKAPPPSCLDHQKCYMEQIMHGPEEADYGTAASPLLLPQSSKMGKLGQSRSEPEIGTAAPQHVDHDDVDDMERKYQEEIERQTYVQSAHMELYRERHASERVSLDQDIDQIQKDAAVDKADIRKGAANSQKKERDRFDMQRFAHNNTMDEIIIERDNTVEELTENCLEKVRSAKTAYCARTQEWETTTTHRKELFKRLQSVADTR